MFSSLVDVNLVLFCGRIETSMKYEDFEERSKTSIANFASSARQKNYRRLKRINSVRKQGRK